MLERFSNKDYILSTKGFVRGITWKQEDIQQLQVSTQIVTPPERPVVELHLYSPGGMYITGGVTNAFDFDRDKITVDYATFFNNIDIERGYYEVVSNIYRNLLGSELDPLIQVKEISADRREIIVRLVPLDPARAAENNTAISAYLVANDSVFDKDIFLNFGKDRLVKVINQRNYTPSNTLENNTIAFRLYQPLPPDVVINDVLWIIESLSDSITDNVNVTTVPDDRIVNILRGPNFEYADDLSTTSETDFQNWNSLLGSNLSTSQQIIDRYFSGSLGGVQLNIDYTAFENFVFYSSAYERLANFKYKLELIEYYDDQLSTLNNVAIGSDDTALQNNITLTTQRKDNVIGGFDGFERWLYSEPTSSLSTHGVSGSYIGADGYSLTPWPKYLSGSKYYLYNTNDTLSISWYDGFSATASFYDEQNNNALVKTVPEHIRNDANNSEYELFINMIGHHFDILYTYVKALSDTYRPEENPKLGRSRETLYHIAESLGWKLSNGNQATALWKYKLGTNYDGTYQSTGSLFSKSNEDISTEVWRRIVNNLPYLLKTKGTSRSIKALMNAYGIPQTLLSIREYGGPAATNDSPSLIEDRFAYAVRLTGESQIYAHMHHVSSSIGGRWGIDRGVIPIMTHEIRFKPSVTESMLLMSYTEDVAESIYVDDEYVDPFYVSSLSSNGSNLWHVVLEHTASYSGSGNYGRIHFIMPDGGSTYTIDPLHATTPWTPMYDGDWWNFRLRYNTTGKHYNSGSNTNTVYEIKVQKKSDFVNSKVVHAASASTATATSGSHYQFWCSPTPLYNLNIGGSSGSISDIDTYGLNAYVSMSLNIGGMPTMYKGNLQEYRAWLETVDDFAFNDHTINPTSYASSISPSSSFDTLVRHWTLGTETKAFDLSAAATATISGSQPFRGVTNFGSDSLPSETSASVRGFKIPSNIQRGNYNAVEETYYVPGTSLGGNNYYSQKIRLDDNILISNLSPINTAERSRYDLYPVDSNKLGMFYSIADQLNKDIFNHIGRVEIDDFIGDPDDEFEYDYPDLRKFAKYYWKKFSDRNDLNAYIRIFSQFDFSLFEQIKQLIPERADYVYGLLIEPHALERVKVSLYKGISNAQEPNINVSLVPAQVTSSGDYFPNIDAVISQPLESNFDFIAEHVGTLTRPLSASSEFLTEHLANIGYAVTSDYCTIFTPPVDERPQNSASLQLVYTASLGSADGWTGVGLSVLNDNTGSTYVTTTGTMANNQQSDELYSVFNVNTEYSVDYDFIFNFKMSALYGTGSYEVQTKVVIWSDDIPVETMISDNTVTLFVSGTIANYGILHDHVSIPPNTNNVALVTSVINRTGAISVPIIHDLNVTRIVNEVCHYGLETIIDRCRPSYIYDQDILHYSGSNTYATRELRNADHFVSQSLGMYYSSSIKRACYHDDFYTSIQNLYYEGCRITAPDINISVPLGGIGYSPVVTVWTTNPNQIIYSLTPGTVTPGGNVGSGGPIGGNVGPGPGNLQPGNLIVR